MLRRAMMCCVSVVAMGFAVQAVRAEDLVEVKKKIESQAQGHQTLREEARMTMDMPGSAGKMTANSTMEFARRGKDKWVSRSDTAMKMPKQEGQAGPLEMKTTSIYDGQYVYSITDQGGQKTAMKTKVDQGGQKAMTDPTGFGEMEKRYDLKLLPDQKVDGKNTWVIEAKVKPEQGQAGEFDRIVMYYDQSNGVAIKTLTYDKAGKVVSTLEVTKLEVDAKIPDERFTLPPGVQVMDMTQNNPTPSTPQETTDTASQDTAKKDSGSTPPPPANTDKPQSSPKKSDTPKDAAKKAIKKIF